MKPFYRFEIERYNGAAFIRFFHVEWTDKGYNQKEVSGYETASRGATASAKREMKKNGWNPL